MGKKKKKKNKINQLENLEKLSDEKYTHKGRILLNDFVTLSYVQSNLGIKIDGMKKIIRAL